MKLEICICVFCAIFISLNDAVNGNACVPTNQTVNKNRPSSTTGSKNDHETPLSMGEQNTMCPPGDGGHLDITCRDQNNEELTEGDRTATEYDVTYNASVGVSCTAKSDIGKCPDYSLHYDCWCSATTTPRTSTSTTAHPSITIGSTSGSSVHSNTPTTGTHAPGGTGSGSTGASTIETGRTTSGSSVHTETSTASTHASGVPRSGNTGGNGAATLNHGYGQTLHYVVMCGLFTHLLGK